MEEDWDLLRNLFKSKKKEIWKELKGINSPIKNENRRISTGARFFLEKVLIHCDPITLYCSARMVCKTWLKALEDDDFWKIVSKLQFGRKIKKQNNFSFKYFCIWNHLIEIFSSKMNILSVGKKKNINNK